MPRSDVIIQVLTSLAVRKLIFRTKFRPKKVLLLSLCMVSEPREFSFVAKKRAKSKFNTGITKRQ